MIIRARGPNKQDLVFHVDQWRGKTHQLKWEIQDDGGLWYGVWKTGGGEGSYTVVNGLDITVASRIRSLEEAKDRVMMMLGKYEAGDIYYDPTKTIDPTQAQRVGHVAQGPSALSAQKTIPKKNRKIGDTIMVNGVKWTLEAAGAKYQVWKSEHGNFNVATVYPERAITKAISWAQVDEILKQKFHDEGAEVPIQTKMFIEAESGKSYPKEEMDPAWVAIDAEKMKDWEEASKKSGISEATWESHEKNAPESIEGESVLPSSDKKKKKKK